MLGESFSFLLGDREHRNSILRPTEMEGTRSRLSSLLEASEKGNMTIYSCGRAGKTFFLKKDYNFKRISVANYPFKTKHHMKFPSPPLFPRRELKLYISKGRIRKPRRRERRLGFEIINHHRSKKEVGGRRNSIFTGSERVFLPVYYYQHFTCKFSEQKFTFMYFIPPSPPPSTS